MASSLPEDDLLLIRCPSCGQRFNVDEQLRGKMVECGECDHQFEIQDAVIIRGKKFYPGEKRDDFLNRISRVDKPLPSATDPGAPQDFISQTNPVVIEPISPQRIVMGVMAVFAMIVTAVILIMGAKRGAALDGVSTENRMLLAGFVSLVATLLLVFSNTRAWLLMALMGLVLGGGLVSLPLFYSGASTRLADLDENMAARRDPNAPLVVAPAMAVDTDKMTGEELREFIGTDPLEEERARLVQGGSTKTALGLWLRNLKVSNSLLIRDYIIREMQASYETHFYPRDKENYLMVVTGIDGGLDELAMAASALGKVRNLHQELGVVEVIVDNERFVPNPLEQLTDPTDPQFYRLNREELESIDVDRIKAAVKRLADVEPMLFREDISKRLVKLLESDWVDYKDDVCRALLGWATTDGLVGQVALREAVALRSKNKEIPQELIALCIKQQNLDVLPLLYELWQENPARWESCFREIGPASERTILLGFDQATGSLRQSSCRILGQVGGAKSLPVLKVAVANASDAETRISAKTAIQMINKRLARTDEEGETPGTELAPAAEPGNP